MKAWVVRDLPNCEYVGVVFAETRGQAKKICVDYQDIIGEVDFTNVSAKRVKDLDKMYCGNIAMDWYNDSDRRAMVEVLDVHCGDEVFEPMMCELCSAKHICGKYEEYQNERC